MVGPLILTSEFDPYTISHITRAPRRWIIRQMDFWNRDTALNLKVRVYMINNDTIFFKSLLFCFFRKRVYRFKIVALEFDYGDQ